MGSRFWREAGETVAVVASVAALGLGWASLAGRSGVPTARAPDSASDPVEMEGPAAGAELDRTPDIETEPQEPEIWLLDGFNVLHTAILRGSDRAEWWTAPRRQALLERVAQFRGAAAEVWVVFDGSDPGAPETGAAEGARTVFAPSADDWLLARVKRDPNPARLGVVTADRSLADRARHRGAQVIAPRAFLERC